MPDFRRYPNEGFPYFVTTSVKDKRCLFVDRVSCQAFVDSIQYLRTNLEHSVHAYVLMPDHAHLVVTPRADSNISRFMHSLKLYTAHRVGALYESSGGMWQARFYERALRTQKAVEQALAYVHNNPVKAGLAERPEDYEWSSYQACVLGAQEAVEVDPLVW